MDTVTNAYLGAKAGGTATKAHLDKAQNAMRSIIYNFKDFANRVDWSFTYAGAGDIEHYCAVAINNWELDRASLPNGPTSSQCEMIWSKWDAESCKPEHGIIDPGVPLPPSYRVDRDVTLPKIYNVSVVNPPQRVALDQNVSTPFISSGVVVYALSSVGTQLLGMDTITVGSVVYVPAISGGSTTDGLLLENGDTILLENGDRAIGE